MNAVKQFFAAHRHVWTLAYFPFYLAAFFALERMPGRTPHIIHSSLDAAIPFCEYFVVPYFLWFIFMAVTLVWFFFRDVPGFYRLMAYLCAGMTVFLLVSALWPNGLHLRPAYIGRDNRHLHQRDAQPARLQHPLLLGGHWAQRKAASKPPAAGGRGSAVRVHHPVHHVPEAALLCGCVHRLHAGLRPVLPLL